MKFLRPTDNVYSMYLARENRANTNRLEVASNIVFYFPTIYFCNHIVFLRLLHETVIDKGLIDKGSCPEKKRVSGKKYVHVF